MDQPGVAVVPAAVGVTDALPSVGLPSTVGVPAPAQPQSEAQTAEDGVPFHPITSLDQLDRIINVRLKKQREQLEPAIKQQALAEVQPQLDEYAVYKQSQMGELEKLTSQLTNLTTENLTLAEKTAAAERKDLIYTVLSERAERLPTKFWPLIEGKSQEEIAASIDSLMADARALAGAPTNGVPPVAPNPEVALGSPASPPAIPQARPGVPVSIEEAQARLDRIRRGDPEAVAENMKQHLPQVGPIR